MKTWLIQHLIGLLLIALLPDLAMAAAEKQNPCAAAAPAQGTLEVQALDYTSIGDGLVLDSAYSAGQSVASGTSILRISSPDIESRLADMNSKIADLKLRRLELEKQSMVNRATLGDYRQRHGELDASTLKHIDRKDEVAIIAQNIQRLSDAVADLRRYRSDASGRFPYPIVLLSNPPRTAQTIRAGEALFSYAWLDRVEVSFSSPTGLPLARRPSHALIGKLCVALGQSRSVLDSKNNRIRHLLLASIPPGLRAGYARQLLSADRQVLLFP